MMPTLGHFRLSRAGLSRSDVRLSNRPVGVKHFQTIRHCSVDVAHDGPPGRSYGQCWTPSPYRSESSPGAVRPGFRLERCLEILRRLIAKGEMDGIPLAERAIDDYWMQHRPTPGRAD
jgi:hypothetical protein